MNQRIGASGNGLCLESFSIPVAGHFSADNRCHVVLQRELIDGEPTLPPVEQVHGSRVGTSIHNNVSSIASATDQTGGAASEHRLQSSWFNRVSTLEPAARSTRSGDPEQGSLAQQCNAHLRVSGRDRGRNRRHSSRRLIGIPMAGCGS